MKKNKRTTFLPIIIFFLLTNTLFITERSFLVRKGLDQEVLIIGNLIIFAVTILSFWLNKRNSNDTNPNVFVRGVMLNTMLKLFVLAIAAFFYIYLFRTRLNKPALITCIALYFIYTLIEVSILTKLLKEKKNA